MPPELPAKLLRPDAYPERVGRIEMVETLLSWVFLTGSYAYKVKKPVRLNFVDFSTVQLRRHFCLEELRCNRAFAPELYLEVIPILKTPENTLTIGTSDQYDDDQVVDFAVKMIQFAPGAQADRLLEEGKLPVRELREFGRTLAAQHAALSPYQTPVDSVTPITDNFATLRELSSTTSLMAKLKLLEQATREEIDEARCLMARRHSEGFTRECHGDLHLQNMVLTERGIRAFDCLEFDRSLRTIDVWCDAAFLVMDCCVRNRRDLGYAFVDGYLDYSGDYEGVLLLPLYARYRSMVRAKVAALQLEQSFQQRHLDRLFAHVEWTRQHHCRPPGRLIVTCGVSGSGKSFWATQLVPELAAIRLRSDVLRKHRHGLASDAHGQSSLQEGLYGTEETNSVYRQLATLATELLRRGENVIVDSTNLRVWQRQLFYAAARTAGSHCILLYLSAPKPVLERRIQQRQAEGTDASEANLRVLEWQLKCADAPSEFEPALHISTEHGSLQQILAALNAFKT